jgi:hypothetical protein
MSVGTRQWSHYRGSSLQGCPDEVDTVDEHDDEITRRSTRDPGEGSLNFVVNDVYPLRRQTGRDNRLPQEIRHLAPHPATAVAIFPDHDFVEG